MPSFCFCQLGGVTIVIYERSVDQRRLEELKAADSAKDVTHNVQAEVDLELVADVPIPSPDRSLATSQSERCRSWSVTQEEPLKKPVQESKVVIRRPLEPASKKLDVADVYGRVAQDAVVMTDDGKIVKVGLYKSPR